MFCEHPKGIFSCGHCRACMLVRINEKMIISVFAAAEYRKKGQFLTLTYRDDTRPDGLQHSDFSSFMKNLRRRDGTPDVKFFVAGEYGEKSGREHFHVLVYNHRYPIELIRSVWDKGFVSDGTLTPKSMKYVSGYVSKRGFDPGSGKRPPYGRSSCNLPDGLSAEEVYEMSRTGKIQYNGRKFSVPKNWRRRYSLLWKDLRAEREIYQLTLPKKESLIPALVSAIMDNRELKQLMKRRGKRV